MKSNILQSVIRCVCWTQLLLQISRAQSGDSCTSVIASTDNCVNQNCYHGRCVDGYNRYWCDCEQGYTFTCSFDSRAYYNGSSCEDVFQKICIDRATQTNGMSTFCNPTMGDPYSSGVYSLTYSGEPFRAFCNFINVFGQKNTVIQRRSGCEIPFYRNWTEYERGFGDPYADYWLGNNIINQITTANQRTVLRIELMDWNNNRCYEEYDDFKIADAQDKYRLLSVGNASGTCGDSLSYHVGSQFSTYDQDNDASDYQNCAYLNQGAWWYNHCFHSNLNGLYVQGGNIMYQGICWYTGKGFGYSYKFSYMMIRKA